MKLIHKKSDDELYCEEEGITYEEDTYFSKRFQKRIINEQGEIIGDLYARIIDVEKIRGAIFEGEGSDFFFELDSISQLCCNVAEYILEIPIMHLKMKNILFLNRLSLKEEVISRENEEKALNILFDYADMVIYSFGTTELDDDDFPERSDDYWAGYERMLNEMGWKYEPLPNFYIKQKTLPPKSILFEGFVKRTL